uniref:Uncharacterized protein n=1 Tax=Trypanosoma vivax (strain Y486) TaxID=1055687 RepID=G0U5Y8_TRYVY|nr:hypothetical protein TVY486_1003420 [Trypanosoma vivax Y486]
MRFCSATTRFTWSLNDLYCNAPPLVRLRHLFYYCCHYYRRGRRTYRYKVVAVFFMFCTSLLPTLSPPTPQNHARTTQTDTYCRLSLPSCLSVCDSLRVCVCVGLVYRQSPGYIFRSSPAHLTGLTFLSFFLCVCVCVAREPRTCTRTDFALGT